jgi:UDP-N-acetylmuramoyl-tripeptide--D-alanyl-D-alanine ligase
MENFKQITSKIAYHSPNSLFGRRFLWRRLLFRTTFIAVTGSVGKTTVKECISAILSLHFSTTQTLHNQNNLFDVPSTILRVRPSHKLAVIEVGSDGAGQIRKLGRLVRHTLL